MRSFLLAALAIAAFATTMTYETHAANAIECVRGVVRAGCVTATGAAVGVERPVVVEHPVVYCKTVGVPKGCVVRR